MEFLFELVFAIFFEVIAWVVLHGIGRPFARLSQWIAQAWRRRTEEPIPRAIARSVPATRPRTSTL